MIVRARPKYLQKKHFDQIEKDIKDSIGAENYLYFNYGRSALKFILDCYSDFFSRKLTVAMQSFNCSVVIEAVLQSSAKVILVEIKSEDFSIDLDELVQIDQNIDVLILTHYQGIPNLQYKEIVKYCKKNNIFLIDDISQTENSYIDKTLVGSLSDVSLSSFSFDKPYTCLFGGALNIQNIQDLSLRRMILERYKALPVEAVKKAKQDIKSLNLLFEYTREEIYQSDFDHPYLITLYNMMFLKTNLLISLLKYKYIRLLFLFIVKIKEKFSSINTKIEILRLHPNKVKLVELQRNDYVFNEREARAVQTFLNMRIDEQVEKKCLIDWNRYSVLDVNGVIKQQLKFAVQCSNYNWAIPLHISYGKYPEVICFNDGMQVTELVCRYVLNIPIWSNYFQQEMAKVKKND